MKNVFDNIVNGNKAKLLKSLETSIFTYQKDVYITHLFNDHNIIGIVLSGTLDIVKYDYDGNLRFISSLEKDSVFGSNISGIFNGEYEVITKEITRVIIIEYDSIIKYNDNKTYYIQFIKNLLDIYNDMLKSKDERIEILMQKSIRNKLLSYFNIQVEKNKSKNIYLPYTFINLADYLAVDRSAMSREIKNLKDEGFIEVKGKKITIKY